MRIVVNSTTDFLRVEAEAKARGQRIVTMRRGRTNSAWVLELSDPPEQAELVDSLQLQVVDTKVGQGGTPSKPEFYVNG